jgi:hypothetical protein
MFVYRDRTFPKRSELAAHLAIVTGHSVSSCENALRRLGDDAERVVAYYREADAAPVSVFRYQDQTFGTQRDLGQHLVPLVGRSLSRVLTMLKDHGNDGDVVAELFRSADDISGLGALAQELRQSLRDIGGTNQDELTVLSKGNDPYRYDHSGGREDARWFADVMDRFVVVDAVHLRGLHYLLVVRANVLKPNGELYRNTFADWTWLMDNASAAARFLGTVPFERIIDERNDPPVLPDEEAAADWDGLALARGLGVTLPNLDGAMPEFLCKLRPVQPYRIVLFGEKSSLAPVLGPVRELVNGELLLPTGESTTTMVFNLAQRCVADGRPAVILYFSDFDPSGWQMGISVARKLQAIRTLRFPDLDCRLYPVAMTYEQVIRLELPSTPLKEGDKRTDRWRAAWNHEQTEIDALAALNPDELTRIAMAAVGPFFDPTLAERSAAAKRQGNRIGAELLAAHPQYADARQRISDALADLEQAADDLEKQQEAAIEAFSDIELPDIEAPEPRLEGEQPEPLYDSNDDFVTATEKLKAHKALYEDEDAE